MVVLALETVTRAGSIAVWEDQVCHAMSGDGSRTHGERLPTDVVDWLAAHGKTVGDVDVFAVVSGPGSFTGLRIGIAAAQGFSLAGHRRVVGISTLDALVEGWRRASDEPALVVPCLDGQRGDVFYAAVEVDSPRTDLDECVRLVAPAVAAPEEAASRVVALAGTRPVVVVGDGAVKYADVFRAAMPGAEVTDASGTLAAAAAWIGARHPDRAGAPHALRPFYLRRPDAELARDRRAAVERESDLDRFVIRRADGTSDLVEVERLQQETFTNAWGADAIRWELEHTDVARLYVLAAPDGRLLAYCACWMVFDELHINSFAVDPAWRRRGLARRLLRHVIAEAAGTGARAATLEVRDSNVAARGLYEGFGFRVEGVRRDYYQDPREDALILWNRSVV